MSGDSKSFHPKKAKGPDETHRDHDADRVLPIHLDNECRSFVPCASQISHHSFCQLLLRRIRNSKLRKDRFHVGRTLAERRLNRIYHLKAAALPLSPSPRLMCQPKNPLPFPSRRRPKRKNFA
jgi:hypothetical protein